MRTNVMTIGDELTIRDYSTTQKGYGRQGLYVKFHEIEGEYYIHDVFPNVEEHFGILLEDDAFYNEEGGYYTNDNGQGEYERTYTSVLDALNDMLSGTEIEVEDDDEED